MRLAQLLLKPFAGSVRPNTNKTLHQPGSQQNPVATTCAACAVRWEPPLATRAVRCELFSGSVRIRAPRFLLCVLQGFTPLALQKCGFSEFWRIDFRGFLLLNRRHEASPVGGLKTARCRLLHRPRLRDSDPSRVEDREMPTAPSLKAARFRPFEC